MKLILALVLFTISATAGPIFYGLPTFTGIVTDNGTTTCASSTLQSTYPAAANKNSYALVTDNAKDIYVPCVSNGTAWESASGTAASFYQTLATAGTPVTQRPTLNFTGSMVCVDNSGASRTDCTPTPGAGVALSPTPVPITLAPIMPLGFSTTATVTVANTTSATTLIGSTYLGSVSLPSGYQVGKTYRIRMSGLYGTTGLPTITFTISLGGVTIGSIAPTLLTSASNDGWLLDYIFTVTSMAAVNGSGCVSDQGTSGAMIGACVGSTTSGLDFTSNQALDVKVTWSAASSSDTITAYNIIVREI